MENIVSEHETYGIIPDEIGTDGEGLGETVRGRLLSIFEADPEIGAISKQTLEPGQVARCGDNQYLPDSGKHKHGDRVIYHRLVENREKLLADTLGYGIQPRPASTGENDSFHFSSV